MIGFDVVSAGSVESTSVGSAPGGDFEEVYTLSDLDLGIAQVTEALRDCSLSLDEEHLDELSDLLRKVDEVVTSVQIDVCMALRGMDFVGRPASKVSTIGNLKYLSNSSLSALQMTRRKYASMNVNMPVEDLPGAFVNLICLQLQEVIAFIETARKWRDSILT